MSTSSSCSSYCINLRSASSPTFPPTGRPGPSLQRLQNKPEPASSNKAAREKLTTSPAYMKLRRPHVHRQQNKITPITRSSTFTNLKPQTLNPFQWATCRVCGKGCWPPWANEHYLRRELARGVRSPLLVLLLLFVPRAPLQCAAADCLGGEVEGTSAAQTASNSTHVALSTNPE